EEQLPPIGEWIQPTARTTVEPAIAKSNGNGNGHAATAQRPVDPVLARAAALPVGLGVPDADKFTDRYGIVVFCHLRWGFVWQRPQQFLSRFAKKHPILFVEEPFFDIPEGTEPRVELHRVMPNVTVATPHCAVSWAKNPKLPAKLREFTQEAIDRMNEEGA